MKSAETWAKEIIFGDAEFTSFTPTDSYMVEFAGLVQKLSAIQQDSNAAINEELLKMLKEVHEAFTTVSTRKTIEEALSGYEVLIARAERQEP